MVNNQRALDSTFAALSDATRRGILARLATGEASVTELAKPYDMSLPAVSKHLRVLESQWRPRELEAAPLKDIAAWVEHYRQFWEAQLDSLQRYLENSTEKEKQPWPKHKKSRRR